MWGKPRVLGAGVVSGWSGPPPLTPSPCSSSIEIDQKLQEIMKQTGYLTIGGQVAPSPRPLGGGGGHSGAGLRDRPSVLILFTSATRQKSTTWRTWGRWAVVLAARSGRCASGRQATLLPSR